MRLLILKCGLILSLTVLSLGYGSVLANSSQTFYPGNQEKYNREPEDSIGGVAAWINKQSLTPLAKITDIYSWIAHHIEYDTKQASIVETPQSLAVLTREVFTSRKAICQGYSVLFNELCRRCSIPSFVVHGIAKMNGVIQKTSHAWVAAYINNAWFLFDPAWGAGFLENHTFVPRFTLEYFMIDPEISIKDRVPFDPIWQLLNHPYSLEEFILGRRSKSQGLFCSFADSITTWLASDEESRLVAEARRLRDFRGDSKLMAGYYDKLNADLRILRMTKEITQKNEIVALYNLAANFYNKAATSYNRYIKAKTDHFKGLEDDDQQVLMLVNEPDSLLSHGETIISTLKPGDPEFRKIIGDLSVSISELRSAVNTEKVFVGKYLNVEGNARVSFFYKKEN